MASSHVLVFVLVCSLVISEAVPRLRPAKKAMRNSLVRFGKRADYEMPQTFQGESYDPSQDSIEGFFPDSRHPIIYY